MLHKNFKSNRGAWHIALFYWRSVMRDAVKPCWDMHFKDLEEETKAWEKNRGRDFHDFCNNKLKLNIDQILEAQYKDKEQDDNDDDDDEEEKEKNE